MARRTGTRWSYALIREELLADVSPEGLLPVSHLGEQRSCGSTGLDRRGDVVVIGLGLRIEAAVTDSR